MDSASMQYQLNSFNLYNPESGNGVNLVETPDQRQVQDASELINGQQTAESGNDLVTPVPDKHDLSQPSEGLTLQERDTLLQNFVRMSLETNFEQNIWLVKRTYWAYASRRLGKHFITTRLSHWIFEFIAEERLKYDQKQNLATDLEKARKWVTDYVKVKNTHHKVPIFRYIRLIQPLSRSLGGDGSTEVVMRILGLPSIEPLYWSPEDLEKQSAEDREAEIFHQKERSMLRELQKQTKEGEDGDIGEKPSTPKKRRPKRKSGEEDDETKRKPARGRKKSDSKEEPNSTATSVDLSSSFPPFEVWEDEESYLVALQVPAIDRSSLEHKISIVGLEVSGSCMLPPNITKRWPGAFEWYPRKWSRQIIFPKPIDPLSSGLVDIQCEGMLFYKCPKQSIQSVSLTNTIKLVDSATQ